VAVMCSLLQRSALPTLDARWWTVFPKSRCYGLSSTEACQHVDNDARPASVRLKAGSVRQPLPVKAGMGTKAILATPRRSRLPSARSMRQRETETVSLQCWRASRGQAWQAQVGCSAAGQPSLFCFGTQVIDLNAHFSPAERSGAISFGD
jgi:hypothetical protein